jgi:hypothetical protein
LEVKERIAATEVGGEGRDWSLRLRVQARRSWTSGIAEGARLGDSRRMGDGVGDDGMGEENSGAGWREMPWWRVDEAFWYM